MLLSVVICIVGLLWLVALLRRTQLSFGLPIAYLFTLLLIHVPGAIAHLMDADAVLQMPQLTEAGIRFTAIGTVCFVVGVWLSRLWAIEVPTIWHTEARPVFWMFTLLAGWLFTSIGFLTEITTIGAAIDRGGAIWMLGVMLGLRNAVMRGNIVNAWKWVGALAVYPLLILLLGGFLSYGSTAAIIVLSALVITAKSKLRLAATTMVAIAFGMSVFLTYFLHRTEIRASVWGGANMQARVDVSLDAAKDFQWFDSKNPEHLKALDLRLNQNYFAGLAAKRIDDGIVDYLHGRSLVEGVMAVIPRALWPDKPVEAGSPKIVAEMTGLMLSTSTSFGVGNVMEFQINFGVTGLVVGFLLLGYAIGRLDRLAAVAEASGNLGHVFVYFLPAIALIQPNGSIIELSGGVAASFAAGYGWKWAWGRWPKPHERPVAAAQGAAVVPVIARRRISAVGRQQRPAS